MLLKKGDQEKAAVFLCASLVSEAKRQKRFANNFKDKSLFRFVESIDGRGWSESDADLHCSAEIVQLRNFERLKGESWIRPPAIACALTHRDRLLSQAEKTSLILCEDDIILKSDFINLWSRNDIRERFQQLDGIVLLHYLSRSPITTTSPPVARVGNYSIYKLDTLLVGSAACYFVPGNIAHSIRQHQTPIRSPADSWSYMKEHGVFNEIYALHPSPCINSGFASTLGYEGGLHSNNFLIVLARRLRRLMQRRIKHLYETLEIRP